MKIYKNKKARELRKIKYEIRLSVFALFLITLVNIGLFQYRNEKAIQQGFELNRAERMLIETIKELKLFYQKPVVIIKTKWRKR